MSEHDRSLLYLIAISVFVVTAFCFTISAKRAADRSEAAAERTEKAADDMAVLVESARRRGLL